MSEFTSILLVLYFLGSGSGSVLLDDNILMVISLTRP